MTASQAQPVSRRTTLGAFVWSAVEGGGLSLISFAALVAFSRSLTPRDFGVFATALSLYEILSLVTNLAFLDALVQLPRLERRDTDTAFTLNLGLGLTFSALFWLGDPIFTRVMHATDTHHLLAILGIGFTMQGASATLVARQRRALEFRKLALRSLVGRIGGAIFGIAAAMAGMGIWSLVLQQLVMTALSAVMLIALADDWPRPGFDGDSARRLIGFGAAAAGAELVNSGIRRVFNVACGVMLGAAVAGYINLAFRLVDTLWNVTATAIYQVILPLMSRLQSDRMAIIALYNQVQFWTSNLLYGCFLALAGAAPQVITVLSGPKWLPAVPYMRCLCLMLLSQAPRMFTVPVLTAMGRPRDVLLGYCAGLIYVVAAVGLFGFRSGPTAIGIWMGTELVYLPVFSWLLYRAVGVAPLGQLRNIWPAGVAGVAMYVSMTSLSQILAGRLPPLPLLVALCGAGAVVYAAVMLACGGTRLRSALDLWSSRIPRMAS